MVSGVRWSVMSSPNMDCMGNSQSSECWSSLVIFFVQFFHVWPRGNPLSLKVFMVPLDLCGLVKEVVHVACHICQYYGVLEVYRYSASVLCSAITHIFDWYSHMCCVITPHFDGVGLMMATECLWNIRHKFHIEMAEYSIRLHWIWALFIWDKFLRIYYDHALYLWLIHLSVCLPCLPTVEHDTGFW
jgi:hypothetical protein